MKSNVCKIDNGTKDLEAILKECERVAAYNGLDHKQTLQLRLLCEEIDGMLPNIIDDFEGDFWIEYEKDVCKVNVSVKIPELNVNKKAELIGIAKDKRNVAAVGIVGKIRNAIEDYFLDEDVMNAFMVSADEARLSMEYSGMADYSYLWSLEQYRASAQQEEQAAAWDELEKSVIASVADDVIVGVKGKRANIAIVKKFA